MKTLFSSSIGEPALDYFSVVSSIRHMRRHMNAFLHLPLLLGMFALSSSLVHADDAEDRILKLASFTEPKGWAKEVREFLNLPNVIFTKENVSIEIELFGGKDSAYPTPEEFIARLLKRDIGKSGQPPREGVNLDVGGKPTPSYYYRRTTFRLRLTGDPSVKFPPPLVEEVEESVAETFVVVPAGERFFVLRFTQKGLPGHTPNEDWPAFLKSFQIRAKPEVK